MLENPELLKGYEKEVKEEHWTEVRPRRGRRNINFDQRFYECDICGNQTHNHDEHIIHRKKEHKLVPTKLPSQDAPLQIKESKTKMKLNQSKDLPPKSTNVTNALGQQLTKPAYKDT